MGLSRHAWRQIPTSSALSCPTALVAMSSPMLSTALLLKPLQVSYSFSATSPRKPHIDSPVGYTTKIEEVDLRVLGSRVLLHRHSTKDTTAPATQSVHHVICVTLKDGTTRAVDPAGPQHRQNKPVMPFDKYKQDLVAKILARRPYGSSKDHLENFTSERHPRQAWHEAVDVKLGFIMEHVTDEFEEWLAEHINSEDLIKASASDYSRLKAELVAHLATIAREFLKLSNGDPTSTTRLIDLNANPAKLSEKDRQRMARKQTREMASMDPSVREMIESERAQGTQVIML